MLSVQLVISIRRVDANRKDAELAARLRAIADRIESDPDYQREFARPLVMITDDCTGASIILRAFELLTAEDPAT